MSTSSIAKQVKFLNKISSTTIKPQILVDTEKYLGLKLTFQYQNHNGNMGARKFWQTYMPTLKFYNPELAIDVIRIKNENKKDVSVPCVLEILSKEGKTIEAIDMRYKNDETIMDELLKKLEHTPVPKEDIITV